MSDPDKYREELNKKWGEEEFDKVWFEFAEGGENEHFSDIDARVCDLDEAGKWDSAETKKLRIEMDSIVDAELEKRQTTREAVQFPLFAEQGKWTE